MLMCPALSRSQNMSRIRARNTAPEIAVRRALHAAGLRYRLHDRRLPGTPDIVLSSRRVIVEVRGCFWHQHSNCSRMSVPSSRQDYWLPKLARNVERDAANQKALEAAGWRVFIVWECQLPGALGRLVAEVQAVSPDSPTISALCRRGSSCSVGANRSLSNRDI